MLIAAPLGVLRGQSLQDGNALSALPASLGDLGPSLALLHAQRNDVARLPASFGALACLRECDLSRNRLLGLPRGGTLPPSLEVLRLHGNALAALPAAAFARLPRLARRERLLRNT